MVIDKEYFSYLLCLVSVLSDVVCTCVGGCAYKM